MVATDGGPVAKRPRPSVDTADQPSNPGTDTTDFTSWPVQNLMRLYYSRLFPHQDFFKWLAYGNDGKHPHSDASEFRRREFCFTLENDIFVRYQSFKDGADLQSALILRLPAKIDIGPVYTADPQQRKAYSDSGQFYPVSRELVFDIDLTDYDDVRTCGSGGHICNACWPLMAVAVQVLDRGLREDFGFENILWVFSGRRGVHCWVCDARARKMTDEQRSALAAYFAVYKGQEEGLAKLFLSATDHPFVARAYSILDAAWRNTILPQQKLLDSGEHRERILAYIPCEETRQGVREAWQRKARGAAEEASLERWLALEHICEQASESRKSDKPADKRLKGELRNISKRIVLAHTYPRLDIEVSKKMNHLLKAPFCVHPKTGKVCVPIDPAAADSFDPDTVPTVGSLLNELNVNASGSSGKSEEWRGTSLAASMDIFQSGFLKGLQAACRAQLNEKAKLQGATEEPMAW